MHLSRTAARRWLLVALAILLAAPGAADDDTRGGEVGLLLGVVAPDESLTADPDTTTEPMFGLRGGSVFTHHLGWFVDVLYADVDTPGAGSVRAVTTKPGATALTRMFHGASSRAQDFVKLDRADLAAP